MFHLRLWKILSEVASAHCNARAYMLNFMLDRRKSEACPTDESDRSGAGESRSG